MGAMGVVEGRMAKLIKRYNAGSIRYESSADGHGLFTLYLSRTGPRGGYEGIEIQVRLDRSDIHCVYRAMKLFADKERQQIQELPL